MRPFLFRLPEWLGKIPDGVPLVGGTQLGGRPVFSYGVMLGTGIALAWLLSYFLLERMGGDRKKFSKVAIWALVGSILGARALYFIASAPNDFTLSAFFRFEDGGLVAYGGFLGGILFSIVVALKTKIDWWSIADAVAPGMLLATGVTRIGCFLFGCDFGQIGGGSTALHYPEWDIAAVGQWINGSSPAHSQEFGKAIDAATPVFSSGLWPTQLMLSLKGFVGFALIMAWIPFRKFRGQMILVFLIYYATVRFLVELLRGDRIRGTETLGLPLSTSQFLAAIIVACAIPLWIYLSKTQRLADVESPTSQG